MTYDVVEVNPVTKKQLGWSTYKKVPIVMVKVKEGYQVDIVVLDLNSIGLNGMTRLTALL